MYAESRPSSNPPFKVDLCCNINIEVHVAMRLGELIKASRTEDKQLMALGHKLAHAMNHLVDQLDNRQWDRLYSHMEHQANDDPYEDEGEGNSYSSKAVRSFSDLEKNDVQKVDMRDYVSSLVSRKD